MATIREDFFTALSKGAKGDVGVSINRTNPLPLDLYSVFQTEAKLDEYIAGKFSYPGQIVAVVGESATTIYYLDQNKVKKPVGVIPTGDSKTIEVTAEGAIGLLGGSGAQNGTLPMIGEDGKLTWKTLEDIGAGDGNDNTTYEITTLKKGEGESAETYGLTIKTLFNGQPIEDEEGDEIPAALIPFDVYTKSEINTKVDSIESKIGVASKPESAEGAGDAVAASGIYKLIEDEVARATSAEGALDTKIGKAATETEDATGVYAYVDGVVKTLVDGVDASKVDSLNDLINWVETHGDVSEIKADIEANADAINVLNGDSTVEGSVDHKIAALNIGDYAKSADVANTYATKEYVGTIPTDEKYADITNVISYINKKAEETLASAQGGSSETAASVKQQLDNYKSENNTKVSKNTEDIATINEKLAGIEDGAQVNVIESVVHADGAKLTVTQNDKTITIDDSALVTLINTAQTKANEAGEAASAAQGTADTAKSNSETNASEIETIKNTTIPGVKAIADKNAEDIAALTTKVAIEEGKVGTLETLVNAKADSSTVSGLAEKVGTNEGNITNLTTRVAANETAITGINETLGNKANSADVYTKTAIDAVIGTPAEGKTLVQMIGDAQTAATYDDTEVKADIKKNTDAIAKLNGDDKTEGSVDYKVAQEVAKILNDNDDSDIDTLNEIAAWITNDTTGAAKMNADIAANATAITKLNGSVETEGSVLSMIAANTPKVATDTILGLVMGSSAENKVSVAADGTMEVNSVNVNKLVQDENSFLVLNGGSANA